MPNSIFRFLRWQVLPTLPGPAFDAILLNYRRVKIGLPPRLPDWHDPRRLSDRIIHLKRNHRVPDAARLCNKLTARDAARERAPAVGLVPLLAAVADPDAIDLSALPQRFVVKPNHASGMMLFCDKASFDWPAAKAAMRRWLSIDYGRAGHEYQYRGFPRRLLIEPDLRELNGGPLVDYRFFCTDGVPRFIQTDHNGNRGPRRDFFDLEWNRLPVAMTVPMSETAPPRPANLDEFLAIASALSVGLRLVRIDLYLIDGVIHFGEFSLHPGGGFAPTEPDDWDERLGAMVTPAETRIIGSPTMRNGRSRLTSE